MPTKTEQKQEVAEVIEETGTEQKESTLYYFYSVGCAFCKKTEPIVDKLIEDGHNILKLDLKEADNQGLKKELHQQYNKQCGTPWFINAETGHQVCGYREEDVIQRWVSGEDIPLPPRPNGPMPKVPFQNSSKKEEKTWTEQYSKWANENSHLPNLQTAEQILSRPRPKTEPPKPLLPNFTDEQLEVWKGEYQKWFSENGHLPNLQPVDKLAQTFIQRRTQFETQQQSQQNTVDNVGGRISVLEDKLDRLMNHLGVK